MPQAALIGLPSVKPLRRFAQNALLFGLGQRRLDDPGDAGGNLVLYGEDVAEVAVVAIGPDVSAGDCIDQLRGDAHPIAGLADAPFEDVAHPQLPPDPIHIGGLALVAAARIASYHEE